MTRAERIYKKADPEPNLISVASSSDPILVHAIAWYERKGVTPQTKAWVIEYMEKGDFSPEMVEVYANSRLSLTTPTMVAVARMYNQQTKLPSDMLDRLNDKLAAISSVQEEADAEESKSESPNIRLRVRESASFAIGEIQGLIDDSSSLTAQPAYESVYDLLTQTETKGPQARIIMDKFRPLLDEVLELKAGTCPQLKEAYSYLTRSELNSYVSLVQSIIDDIQRYIDNQKLARPRKTRKKRVQSADKLVAHVKYLDAYPQMKIVSIAPQQIIGAESVWLYNTKYRRLSKLDSRGPAGLGIKGTTITGYDVDGAICKTLRKPEVQLPQVLDASRIKLRKIMDTIKCKNQQTSGRLNSETIILRVIR